MGGGGGGGGCIVDPSVPRPITMNAYGCEMTVYNTCLLLCGCTYTFMELPNLPTLKSLCENELWSYDNAVLSEIKEWKFSCGIEGIPVTLHTLWAKPCAERCDEDLAAYEYHHTIIAESWRWLGLPLIGAYQNCVLCRYVWHVIIALADLRNEINSGELTAMFWSVTPSGIVGVSRCRRQLCSIIMTGQVLHCDLTNITFNSRITRNSKGVLVRITNGFMGFYAKIWRFKT